MTGATLGAFFGEEPDNYDKECFDAIDTNKNMLVPWYLMAAYAYYEEDNPIISDNLFDKMGKRMLECWDDIEHFHKHYITPDMLEAGTYLGEYPSRVEGAVRSLRGVRNEGSNVVRPNRRGSRRSKNS